MAIELWTGVGAKAFYLKFKNKKKIENEEGVEKKGEVDKEEDVEKEFQNERATVL